MKHVTLKFATEKDVVLLHQMQREAFLPLYEKYHDDEMNPAKESLEKVMWRIIGANGEYYLIQADGETAGEFAWHGKKYKEAKKRYIWKMCSIFLLCLFCLRFKIKGLPRQQ